MSLRRMSAKEPPAASERSSAPFTLKTKADHVEDTISGLEELIADQEKFSGETREKLAEFLGARIVAGEAQKESENQRESQKESKHENQRESQSQDKSRRGGFTVSTL